MALGLCSQSHPEVFFGASFDLAPLLESPVKEPSHSLPLAVPPRVRLFTLGWNPDFSASFAGMDHLVPP